MHDLALLIPTRGRPGNIRKVISAWDFTNAWDHAQMILVADADDPEIQGYYDLVEETRNPDTGEALIQLAIMDEWMPMVHKLDTVANLFAQARTHFALGFAGDDHLPRTINWAKRYLTVLRELKTGMVHGDDGFQGKNIGTEWAVTSDVVRTLGRMIPAPVEHMWSDVSLHDLMTAAGAIRYLPEVRIEHMHPIVGKAENDEQYQRVNSREQFARDRAIYDNWKNGTMSAQLAAVRALRPDRQMPPRKERRMNRSPFPRHFKQVPGATPEEIGIALADFAMQVPKDQAIVELGVYRGRTTLQMAWGAQQGNGAHVWGIDAWDLEGNTYGPPFTDPGSYSWAKYWTMNLGYSNQITLVKGFSIAEASGWTGPPVGLLFVDDDHSYEGARGAILAWAPHLAEGARIAVDNYGHPDWPGVKEAVDALVDEGVLAPVEIYHDRLAVTHMLRVSERDGREWIDLLPDLSIERGGLAFPVDTPWVTVPLPEPDTSVSNSRLAVAEGELNGVAAGTLVAELTIPQMKTLARRRNIVLGPRKDKRGTIIEALAEGK